MAKKIPSIHINTVSSPIASDTELEKTLNLGNYTYYVGALFGKNKPYLPVRVAPYGDGLDLGWSDNNYSTSELSVPLGHPIEVVEIVESETGVWAGFLSEGKILYTDVGYVRIIDGKTCPSISKRFLRPDDPLSDVYVPEGSKAVSPKDNQNWLSLSPHDIRLTYYNFNEHNDNVVDVSTINMETINRHPTLRCSEGYYYFVLGENERQSEAVTSGEIYGQYKSQSQIEEDKLAVSNESITGVKESAYKNLLNYLGKKDNTPSSLANPGESMLMDHFVLAGLKVNTQTANPNNQKALFAIRSSYVDALPDKTFSEIFDDDSPYKNGRNYAFTAYLKELPKICSDLATKFKRIKSKLESSQLKVTDVSDLDYDINIQIEQIERFSKEIDNFLSRQSYPATTDMSDIIFSAKSGTKSADTSGQPYDNIIQINIVDNRVTGCGARETISHILFSPDPKILEASSDLGNINLFDFDPYISDNELSGKTPVKRSAIHLKVAVPYLREIFSGVYGSRTLHLLLSHSSITKFLNDSGPDLNSYDWAEFLQKYCVPPLKIYPSKDPQKFKDPDDIDCDELIAQLNKSGPNVGRQEKLLQEKLYNNEKCKEKYFDQFKDATHAGDPSLKKKSLEETNEDIMAQISAGDDKKFLSTLFQGFFHVLDPMALLSLLLACLQKKLGMMLSIEAICEAAILELVKTAGPEAATAIIITNALLSPERDSSKRALAILGDPESPYADPQAVHMLNQEFDEESDQRLILDDRFDGAPVASALIVGEIDIPAIAIETIRNMEKGGQEVQLNLAYRPTYVGQIVVPTDSPSKDIHIDKLDPITPGSKYTQKEVDGETKRLLELGYTERESRALMVQNGYMVPDEEQWRLFASNPMSFENADDYSFTSSFSSTANYSPADDDREVLDSAKAWLNYMKANIGNISELCELIVGDLLSGLEKLLKDPLALLGGLGDWLEDFIETLKRAFKFKIPSLRFPDNLGTDSHMGDYGKKLLMMILSMVALILGQIVHLLIKEALEKCLEENHDQGPGPNPVLGKGPSLTIPTLRRAGLPSVGGISDADIVAWMKDLIDNLSTGQLCALLRGDASKQTLKDCLVRTEVKWPVIYNAGIDTIYEIRVAFEKLGKNLDLDICKYMSSSAPVVIDACKAIYDSDARCEELQKAGLTKEECDAQIKDELNDLKNKVIALAGLGMFGMDPMSNLLPPACGEGGFFEMPPGVKDSMSRVTDNILTTVKGSLIQDLTSLEFFAVPPRAIIAATDPAEMKKMSQSFTNSAKKPYNKLCFAHIGNPFDSSVHRLTDWSYDSLRSSGLNVHRNYPLVYNRFLHYGGFSTGQYRDAKNPTKYFAWDSPLNAEHLAKSRSEADELNKRMTIAILEATKLSFFCGMPEDEEAGLSSIESFVENSNFLEPIHVGALYRNQNWPAPTAYKPAHDWSDKLLSKRYSSSGKYTKSMASLEKENDIVEGPSTQPHNKSYWDNVPRTSTGNQIDQAITNAFSREMKPFYIRDMVINYLDLILTGKRGLGPIKAARGRVWPLDTKLHEITFGFHGLWLAAFQAYCGIAHNVASYGQIFGWVMAKKKVVNMKMHFTNCTYPALDNSVNVSDAGQSTVLQYGQREARSRVDEIADNLGPSTSIVGDVQYLGTCMNAGSNNTEMTYGYTLTSHKANDDYPWSEGTTKIVDIPRDSCSQGWYYATEEISWEEVTFNNESLTASPFNYDMSNESEKRARDLPEDAWGQYTDAFEFTESDFPVLSKAAAHAIEHAAAEIGDKLDDVHSETNTGVDWKDYRFEESTFVKNMKISPGLVKIYMICQTLLEELKDNEDELAKFNADPALYAFTTMTIAEAFGLETHRTTGLFPNFGPIESIEGVVFTIGKSQLCISQTGDGSVPQVRNIEDQLLPQYAVFKQHFADPESPLSLPKDEMIEYFSSNKEKVNPELYEALTNEDNFNQNLGFNSEVVPNPIATYDPDGWGAEGKFIETRKAIWGSKNKHYNPDIIKIDTSFTELSAKTAAGFSGEDFAAKILGAFSAPGGSEAASEQFALLSKQLEFINKKESLIYQNIALPLENNISTQLSDFRDTYTFIKGKLANYNKDHIIGDDTRIGGEKYNFNFGKKLDDDIQDVLGDVYSSVSADTPAQKIIKDYKDGLSDDKSYNPLNFKAQIFGKLLSRRFIDMYNEHKPESANTLLHNGNFEKAFRHNLANNSFAALQMAQVHQVFAKLKDSRLHQRGMMKKIWKKILHNPLNASKIDPRCLDFFTPNSRDDLSDAETDFFKLSDVKQRIMAFYEKSICQDVYEKSSSDENAARKALLQGCVILLVKIYTLEVCLTSIIAWDSYALSDIVKDDILVKIIVNNIKEDVDINLIAFIANDILRKEKGLSDIDLAYYRGEQSGLEYLIKAESQHIVKTVKNIFSNSDPMTLDLNLQVLKSSDVTPENIKNKVQGDAPVIATEISAFHKDTGKDYVVDARFGSNAYTMNYGQGHKKYSPYSIGDNMTVKWENYLWETNLFDQKTISSQEGVLSKNNRNFFHSLPMNHRSSVIEYAKENPDNLTPEQDLAVLFGDTPIHQHAWPGIYAEDSPSVIKGYEHYRKESFFNSEFPEWSEFQALNNLRKNKLHNEYAFSKENFVENTMGNDPIRLLGNTIIQPYVRIVDIPEDEKDEYWGNMTISVLKKIEGSDIDPDGEPCEPKYNLSDPISALDFKDVLEGILAKRDEENNIFKSYMWGYIPLSAWSHFYNTIFLKTIFSHTSNAYANVPKPLYELYKKYGFRLIFKEFKIGLRLTYSVPTENFDSLMSNSSHKVKNIMESAFTGEENIKGLKACKSLYVQRPYFYNGGERKEVLTELHIPIVEVEKSLTIQEGESGFTIDDNENLFDLDELGFWAPNIEAIASQQPSLMELARHGQHVEGAGAAAEVVVADGPLKYLINTPYSFFYKHLAQDLVVDLKSSPEFKLIYEHCIPIRRYMVLGFTYAADGLSKFIPEPTDVLDETKEKILMIMSNLINSQDYKFVPDDVLSALDSMSLRNMSGTTGKEPDMTKLILKIIYKTMFMILKGFVEITDPAIQIATLVIEIANAVVMTTLGFIEAGITTAKMIQEGFKISAEIALQSALIQFQIAAGIANSLKGATLGQIKEDGKPLSDFIIIEIEDENSDNWVVEIDEGPELDAFLAKQNQENKDAFNKFKETFDKMKKLHNTFKEAEETLQEITDTLNGIIGDLEKFHKDAKKTMDEVFESKYLLPGLWAALLPSMIPYGGGIIPPPFFVGPPSTIPGVIYLILLLIDAIDDKQHNDNLSEPDCDKL